MGDSCLRTWQRCHFLEGNATPSSEEALLGCLTSQHLSGLLRGILTTQENCLLVLSLDIHFVILTNVAGRLKLLFLYCPLLSLFIFITDSVKALTTEILYPLV